MLRFPMFAFFAAACLAQTAPAPSGPKPPAKVDRALRRRIQEFDDLQVQGQYRKAEAFVAQDTKDFYYGLAKPKYKSLEILSIEYSSKFTRAKAIINCERYINAPPYPPDVPLKGRFVSLWKREKGKWYYYEDPSTYETPFGKMRSGVAAPPGAVVPAGVAPPGATSAIPATPDFVFHQVRPDRESVTLKPGESAEVAFTNRAPGQMSLAVDSKPAGVDVKIDRAEIPAGGKSVVTIHAGKGAKPGAVALRVVQTTEVIPIQVTVK